MDGSRLPNLADLSTYDAICRRPFSPARLTAKRQELLFHDVTYVGPRALHPGRFLPAGGGLAGGFMIVGHRWRYSPQMTHDHGRCPFLARARGIGEGDAGAVASHGRGPRPVAGSPGP